MSERSVIEHALRVYFADSDDPDIATKILDEYNKSRTDKIRSMFPDPRSREASVYVEGWLSAAEYLDQKDVD